jgi:hypothetical protein
MRYGALNLVRSKHLGRHVAELDALCDGRTIVGIVESTRATVAGRLSDARSEVQEATARSRTQSRTHG